ncbi:MAG: diguanylate cyclase [Cyanobacteria bacterium]|nr:diguanylate cyclase [Cyanobacteriota bacterium]
MNKPNKELVNTVEIFERPRVLILDKNDRKWWMEQKTNLVVDITLCTDSSELLLKASQLEFDAIILGVAEDTEKKSLSITEEVRQLPTGKNLPVAFLVDEEKSMSIISKAELTNSVILVKPLKHEIIASCITKLLSFNRLNAFVISESPQMTAQLVSSLNECSLQTHFTLRPNRCFEFLYDYEPEIVFLDIDIRSQDPITLCGQILSNERWKDSIAIIIFSSKGEDCDKQVIKSCGASGVIDFSKSITRVSKNLIDLAGKMKEKRRSRDCDPLTGLQYRDHLYEKYIPLLKSSIPSFFNLVWLDVQDLKTINADYGHEVGDRVVQTISTFLLQRLESVPSFICRWDSDEFIIVLKCAREVAEQLIKNAILDLRLIKIEGLDKDVSLNAGIAQLCDDGQTLDELLDVAKWRLHTAKRESVPLVSK